MEKEEKKLHALEQIYHCRSRTLQETKENSEGKKKNVRIRVPQESRKIANRLKVTQIKIILLPIQPTPPPPPICGK